MNERDEVPLITDNLLRGYMRTNKVRSMVWLWSGVLLISAALVAWVLSPYMIYSEQGEAKRASNDAFLSSIHATIESSPYPADVKNTIGDRINQWLDSCSIYVSLPMMDWLGAEELKQIVQVASQSRLVCAPGVPIAEDPASYGQSTLLSLPFDGPWYVVQGNSGIVSHLKGTKGEFSWDFIIQKDGRQAHGESSVNENHYCWGQEVLAPAPGKVVKVLETLEDHDPYMPNPPDVGNHVYIDHENGEISLLYHLQKNSAIVDAGQRVERGQAIGLCGDTGISMFPYLHFQLYRGTLENHDKMATRFSGYMAWVGEKSGEAWEKTRKLRLSGKPRRLEYVMNAGYFLRTKIHKN